MIANRIKTVLLLVLLSCLFLVIGRVVGGTTGLHIAFFMAIIVNIGAYFFSDKIVLAMYNARPLDRTRYPQIYENVFMLAQRMSIPMPALYLIDSPMANAFATGRNPAHASVAITTGIINILDQRELTGVLAHELSHVKNRDILIATIAATMATAVSYMANMAYYLSIFSSSNDRDRSRGPGFLGAILISILMPIAASFIQLAISRSREYLADETGATYSNDPLALSSALEKLHYSTQAEPLDSRLDANKASTASLFIVYPFRAHSLMALFSTHPPMDERIRRLRAMANKMKGS